MARIRPENSTGLDLSDIETNILSLEDGVTAPSATSGFAKIYVDTSGGDLKVIFSDGTVKTIVIGGGGITQEVVAGTPVSPDGTKSFYDFDISTYASVDLVLDGIAFGGSDRTIVRLSTDGGSTFKADATDYAVRYISHGQSVIANLDRLETTLILGTTNHYGSGTLSSLKVGRAVYNGSGGRTGSTAYAVGGHARFAGPITDIRVLSILGNDFTAGTFWLIGQK